MAARLAGCAVMLVAGCFNPHFDRFTMCGPGGACPNGGPCNAQNVCAGDAPDDAGADSPLPGADSAPLCAGTFIHICLASPVTPAELHDPIDTSETSSQCMPRAAYSMDHDVAACLIVVKGAIAGVTVGGDRPLIVFSTSTLTVSGTLDVASHQGGAIGPAADLGCSAGTPPTLGPPINEGGLDGGGGGWGGSFGAMGGSGGDSVDREAGDGTGGVAPAASGTVMTLRGGCAGGSGIGMGNNGGAPGHGGGAVLLIAAQSLTIAGTVNASGGGGGGGKQLLGGGGGGGSGGMIVLDAPTVQVPGQCFANGGGGGESGTNKAPPGRPGSDSIGPSSSGQGGSGVGPGGDGGAGGFAVGSGKDGSGHFGVEGGSDNATQTVSGGGGGGGGVGVIKVLSASTLDLTKFSPAPQPGS